MEETPEQVLARLQRYADSLKARGQVVAPRAALPLPAVSAPRVDAHVMTVEAGDVVHSFGTVSRTIVGQVIWVVTCVITLLVWVNFERAIAYLVVLAAAAGAGIGLARRVPFTGWVLVGLLCGLVLGRFS